MNFPFKKEKVSLLLPIPSSKILIILPVIPSKKSKTFMKDPKYSS